VFSVEGTQIKIIKDCKNIKKKKKSEEENLLKFDFLYSFRSEVFGRFFLSVEIF
jgi:hypothetical protein